MSSDALKKKIDELWVDTADVKPEDYDFSEHPWSEDWELAFNRTDEEMENGEWEPMMNYRYHLPDFEDKNLSEEDIKKALKHVNLTLIEDLKSGEKYLVLTGGGMDMRWDIVKAYANLGFTPPAYFCRDLPSFSGNKLTLDNKEAIMACRKSLEAQSEWNQRGLEKLDDLEKTMKENLRQWKEERKLRK